VCVLQENWAHSRGVLQKQEMQIHENETRIIVITQPSTSGNDKEPDKAGVCLVHELKTIAQN